MTFDSWAEFRAWHEFRLLQRNGDVIDLCHHERFPIQPERWEKAPRDSDYPQYESQAYDEFSHWYRENVVVDNIKKTRSHRGWLHTPAEYYESDITFVDSRGRQHVVEVKKLSKKTGRPFFAPRQSEKQLYRIAWYLWEFHGIILEVYTGEWWAFNEKGRLIKRVAE